MLTNRNKIRDIKDSTIGVINQTNIEKQEINNTQIINGDNKYIEMTISHELFPFYRVDYVKSLSGKYTLKSIPTCKEATTIYPPYAKVEMTVVDERFKGIKDPEELWDKMAHADSPVEFKPNSWIDFLGDVKDPYPDYTLSPIQDGVKMYMIPQKIELPNIKIKTNIIFKNSNFIIPNIEFKLVKKLSSHEFILNNYHQKDVPILFELSYDIKEEENFINTNLNFKINANIESENNTKLIYHKFILNMFSKSFEIIDIENDRLFMRGKKIKKLNDDKKESIKQFIGVIEKIIEIETYFDIKFKVENKISKEEVIKINNLYNYIIASSKKQKIPSIKITQIKKESNIEHLKELSEQKEINLFSGLKDVEYYILDKKINIEEIRTIFPRVKLSNVEDVTKIIEKINDFDDEYEIELIFVSAKNKFIYPKTEIIKA